MAVGPSSVLSEGQKFAPAHGSLLHNQGAVHPLCSPSTTCREPHLPPAQQLPVVDALLLMPPESASHAMALLALGTLELAWSLHANTCSPRP